MYLAFDGGTTDTSGGLFDANGEALARAEGGPCNPLVAGMEEAVRALSDLSHALFAQAGVSAGPDLAIGAGISGCAKVSVRERMAESLVERIGASRAIVTDDLRPILFANARDEAGVVVVAGTGSNVIGHDGDGTTAMYGGRGTVIGDDGSSYELAVAGMRAAARAVDGIDVATPLVDALVHAALGAEGAFADLPAWTHQATKSEVAGLARVVCATAEDGDPAAARCVAAQATALAEYVCAAFAGLSLPPDAHVFMVGGLMHGCAPFRETFEAAVRDRYPEARLARPELEGDRAALALVQVETPPEWVRASVSESGAAAPALPPTEEPITGEPALDRLPPAAIVSAMNQEDARAAEAVGRQREALARAVTAVADAFRAGGRLIYLGAGTSGRLGVLDASECPPTFGVPAERVVGLIAGGDRALRESIEGSEDRPEEAREALRALTPPPGPADVVVGIAASGNTPYVHGGLLEARERGAGAWLLCCNPRVQAPDFEVIALDTGAEALTGSTRLKAGSATKMALNILTTGAMARAGYIYEGYMVRVRPLNRKLAGRCARIIAALTGCDEARGATLLEAAHGDIPVAVLMERLGLDEPAARARLDAADWDLRAILE